MSLKSLSGRSEIRSESTVWIRGGREKSEIFLSRHAAAKLFHDMESDYRNFSTGQDDRMMIPIEREDFSPPLKLRRDGGNVVDQIVNP